MMDKYLKEISQKAEEKLLEFPDHVDRIETLIQDLFKYKTLSESREAFASVGVKQNKEVIEAMNVTLDELYDCEKTLRVFSRWLALLNPKIEDGNNFGVEILVIG